MRRRARVDDAVGVRDVVRERYRLTRAGVTAVSLTLVLATAGTAAFVLSGRRSPAAANVLPGPVPPAVLGARLSATAVTYGGQVTVTGVLRGADGRPLGGRVVEVRTAPAGDPTRMAAVDAVVAAADGQVTASVRPSGTSDVTLYYAGGDGVGAAVSPPARVHVAARVTLAVRTRRVGGGWTATVHGEVAPARPGGEVRLERRVRGGWRHVLSGRLSGASTYVFTVRERRAGRYEYRVTRPADAALAGGSVTGWLELTAPPRRAGGSGGRGTLLVAGDSFAFYLGHQLAARRAPRPTVIESKHSSGLSRPDFFDWTAAARTHGATRPGAVVLFLGANDCQPIRAGGTGAWALVGTRAWIAEYQRRAAGLMRAYGGGGARPVVWVGLPIVAKPDVEACYRAINAATAAAARAATGVAWVDTWAVYAVNGRYSDTVAGVHARQEDGIHLTFAGTRLLTRRVYALL